MKLIFLGSGSAFVPSTHNYHSNIVVETSERKRLLIDCGSDARHSAREQQLTSKDFDAVYISHLHADHAGGLEWLAFTTKFDAEAAKPKLVIHPSLLNPLWDHVLSGGLNSIEDEKCTIKTYFDLYPIHFEKESFVWEGICFKMVKTEHYYHNHQLLPSYGLYITHASAKLFITTDTLFNPEKYMQYYNAADLIFHDCDILHHKPCVHADFDSLSTLPLSLKNKMWLYHYSEVQLPDAKASGFKGFVKKGQVFYFPPKDK